MRASSLLLLIPACVFLACDSESPEPDRILNGVNVTVATSTFNSHRAQGITGYPGAAAVTWNDTLSTAAYSFAVAKATDTSPNNYTLSDGRFILNFPAVLGYRSGGTRFALHFSFRADADVEDVIASGFASSDPLVMQGLMSPTASEFGMGQYGDRWYVIVSD